MRKITFLLQKEFIQIFRNKTMLPIIFVMPVVQLLVLANAATFEMKNIRLYIIDNDLSSYSREITGKFQGSRFYTVVNCVFDVETAKEALKANAADAILVIPPDFEKKLVKENKQELQIIINAIDGSAASLISGYTLSIIKDYNIDLISRTFPEQDLSEPIKITHSFWFNPELNYITYMVPGILVVLVTLIGMFLSSMNIVREKEIGTIEQINVTPIRKSEFIAGKLIPFWIIALFELGFGLLIGKIVFSIPIVGSVMLIFFVAAIFLLAVLGLGLIISTLVNTQQQAMFISWFVLIIFIMLSGLFTPVEGMPRWAIIIDYFNPIYYFIKMIRMIMLKGSGLVEILPMLGALSVYALASITIAVIRYRKTA